MVVVWSKSVLYSFICIYQFTDMHWQRRKGRVVSPGRFMLLPSAAAATSRTSAATRRSGPFAADARQLPRVLRPLRTADLMFAALRHSGG